MTTTPLQSNPEAIFRSSVNHLWNEDLASWLDLLHDDVVFEFPFAPTSQPRTLKGKTQIAEYMRHIPGMLQVDEAPSIHVHRTTDDAIIIVEMSVSATVKATGAPFAQQYVVILTVTDGKIARYRDYWNPLVAVNSEVRT